jgi:hypothetical protein
MSNNNDLWRFWRMDAAKKEGQSPAFRAPAKASRLGEAPSRSRATLTSGRKLEACRKPSPSLRDESATRTNSYNFVPMCLTYGINCPFQGESDLELFEKTKPISAKISVSVFSRKACENTLRRSPAQNKANLSPREQTQLRTAALTKGITKGENCLEHELIGRMNLFSEDDCYV